MRRYRQRLNRLERAAPSGEADEWPPIVLNELHLLAAADAIEDPPERERELERIRQQVRLRHQSGDRRGITFERLRELAGEAGDKATS